MAIITVYTSDKDGVYAGPREARESPREPGVPLITLRDALMPPPRDAVAGHVWRLVDGEWVETVDNRGVTYWTDRDTSEKIREIGVEVPDGATLEQPPLPPLTFDRVVSAKITSLTAAYAAEITGDIEYKGFIYQADERTVQALESALRLWSPNTLPPDFVWWDVDNNRHPFSCADLAALLRMIDTRAADLPTKLRDKKDEALAVLKNVADGVIDEGAGVALVQAIEW